MKFADSVNNDAVNNVSGDTLVSVTGINLEKSEDTLAAGDVVVYALIDGNIRAQKAENETSRVTSINRSTTPLTATISEEKKESAVHTHSEGLASGVTNMVIGTNYTSYFDLYGNLAAYTEGEVGKFVLITDGWFKQAVNAREYAVQAYVDGQLQNVDITNNGQLFIETNSTSNNNWNHLKALGGTTGVLNAANGGTFLKTTVACLDGGNLLPVEQSTYYRQRVAMLDMVDNAIPVNNGSAKGNAYITSANYNSASAYDTAKVVTNADGSTTAHTNVEVLGRSDTVYYTVYKTGINTVTGQPNYVVRSYTGYANVPNINRMYIEDVYAVGIEATRTNATNFTPYYTAEVVVIELNSKYQYQNDSEQVFIPGITVVNNDVSRTAGYGIETITMIRANGEVQDVQVDMSQSNVRWYNIAGNSAANRIFAGLYYMDPTDSNPNVYRIRPMTQDDIRANNYMAGYVTQSTAIVPTDYVRVDMQLFNGARDANGNLIAMNTPIDAASGNYNITATQEKSVSANSKLYTLGYSGNFVASLGKDKTAGEVFLQNPYRNTSDLDSLDPLNELWNGTNFSNNPRNEVLVRYDGNTVVWAISFREYRTGSVRDFAQTVWYDCLPAQTAQTPVTFWGVGDNDAANLDQNRTAGTIEISHSTAVANADKGIVDVNATAATVRNYTLYRRDKDTAGNFLNTWTPMTANQEDNAATNGNLSTAREEYRLVINPNNGAVQTEYYLIKLAATSGADMKLKKNALPGAVLNTVAPELGTLPAAMELDSYMAQYEISSGATATWTFVTNGGKQIVFQGKNLTAGDAKPEYTCTSSNYETQTTTDINYVTVTVVAEQGNATNTYRSANVPAVTVQPSAGVTVNGVGGNQTVYFGQVLSVKAPSTGKLVINGTSYDVNSANNFTVEYTVPVDATTVVITFTADTTTPSANGKLTLGTITASGVKVATDSTGSVTPAAGYNLGNTNGSTTVYVKFESAAAGTYVLQMSNATGKVLTAGNIALSSAEAATTTVKSANVSIPDGEWTLTIVKQGSAQTLTLNVQQSAGGGSQSFPEVAVKINGTTVDAGSQVSIDAFGSATVTVDAPAGYVIGVPDIAGFTVTQNGTANEWTITNDNANTGANLIVSVSADANYKLVRVDANASADAIFYKDNTKAVTMTAGATYSLPINGKILVSAKNGCTVGDVGRWDPTTNGYVWNERNGATNTANGDVEVAILGNTDVVTATTGQTRWYANVQPTSHGANYYIGQGYHSAHNNNVRWLAENDLRAAVEGGELNFSITDGTHTENAVTKVEVLSVARANNDSTSIWKDAGLVKVHTCPEADMANEDTGYGNACAGKGVVKGSSDGSANWVSGVTATLNRNDNAKFYKWIPEDDTGVFNTATWN